VELTEDERGFHLTAELPGLHKRDVHVSFDQGVLTVRGEKRFEEERERGRVRIRERAYGSFERSFALPPAMDASAIDARFHRGVLEVHVPKTASRVPGGRIEIE
jgi:HSP20 family protein